MKFDGIFNAQTRMAFYQKRLSMGLSRAALGRMLRVNAGTIRKWELGNTAHCGPRHVAQVKNFLDGKLDDEIHQKIGDPLAGCYVRMLPEAVANVVRKAAQCYLLLEDSPHLQQQLIEDLFAATDEAVASLVGRL